MKGTFKNVKNILLHEILFFVSELRKSQSNKIILLVIHLKKLLAKSIYRLERKFRTLENKMVTLPDSSCEVLA